MVPERLIADCLVTCLGPGDFWAIYIIVVAVGLIAFAIYLWGTK